MKSNKGKLIFKRIIYLKGRVNTERGGKDRNSLHPLDVSPSGRNSQVSLLKVGVGSFSLVFLVHGRGPRKAKCLPLIVLPGH